MVYEFSWDDLALLHFANDELDYRVSDDDAREFDDNGRLFWLRNLNEVMTTVKGEGREQRLREKMRRRGTWEACP